MRPCPSASVHRAAHGSPTERRALAFARLVRGRGTASRACLRCLAGLCVWAGLAAASPDARAQVATTPHATAQLGRPARALALTVGASGERAELLADGHAVAPLPFAPSALSVRDVALPEGTLALVEASADGRRFALLLARRGARVVVVDAGVTTLEGDPGERRAHVLTVTDGDPPRVLRATVAERVGVCGEAVTWLDTQALDPRTLTFHDDATPTPSSRAPTQTRVARAVAVDQSAAPRLDALRFDVASSGGGEASFERAPRPQALTDRDPSTAWVEAESVRGALAFATGRYDASEWPVRRISLVPLAAGSATTVRAPSYIDVTSPEARVRIQLPAAPRAGERYEVELDPPLHFRCVSVVLPTPSSPGDARVGLAELAFHSEFDAADGTARLLAELASGGARATGAARLLRGLGAEGASAIAGAWPDMTPRERRLALRVLSDLAASEPAARSALLAAGRDADEELRAAAIEALRAAGAGNELTTLMNEGDDAAAQVLARAIPGRALQVLLPALAADGGATRVGLRAAVGEAVTRAPTEAVPLVAAWATSERSVEATALVAQALALGGDAGQALGGELLRGAVARAESFEEVWRVVLAAGSLPAEPTVDAWLAQLVTADERWMVRAEAANSLAARAAPQAPLALRALASDEFPRARERAALLLGDAANDPARAADDDAEAQAGDRHGGVESARAVLLRLAQRDPWPRVRAAAVTALASDADARALLVGALSDPKARVRLAAIEAFRTTGDPRGAEAVAARLARTNELSTVQRAAARYLGQVCAADHQQTLMDTVARGRRPNAYDPDVQTAVVAVAALGRLGGPEVASFLAEIRTGGPPEAIRAAAERALEALGACQVAAAPP